MTDTIEAAALALRQCADENYDIRFDYGMAHEYAKAVIAAHTKALIEGAGEVERILLLPPHEQVNKGRSGSDLHKEAAATIAALTAEIEQLTANFMAMHSEYIAKLSEAKEEGVRAGIEAALRAHQTAQYDPAPYSKGRQAILALDPAAIAKGV